jgi:tryptophan-rich sensory protein
VSTSTGKIMPPVAAAFACALAVSIFGALATQIGPWYFALKKPSWQPPDWLFGPVWTLIFGLAALAAVLAWRHAPPGAAHLRIVLGFVANMILNSLWSVLFFRLQRPDWALVEVAFLWASIVIVMMIVWQFSHAATWLLAPYLLWVSFASYLNLTIVQLNQPFV